MELFKLRVENLGRIRIAELGIRPLTVFVGPNNTNKTWTAYALYGLAKSLSWHSVTLRLGIEDASVTRAAIDAKADAIVEKAVSDRVAVFPGTGENALFLAEVGRRGMLEELEYPVSVGLSAASLSRLLAEDDLHFKDSRVSLELGEQHLSWAPCDSVAFRFDAPTPPACSAAVTRKRNGAALSGAVHCRVEDTAKGEFERNVLRMGIEHVLLGRFERAIALPAERKGLVALSDLFSEQAIRESLSEPAVDFISLLWNATARLRRREHLQQLPEAVEVLESYLLGGSLKAQRGDTPSSLLYECGAAAPLRMHAASSLVRALAGLDLYLRSAARPGDFLIIDEPEMNAHPEAQLMIAELLGILVNRGVSVLITTHSPYIVDHINNLVVAGGLDDAQKRESAGLFALQTPEAFLPQENVAAYLFDEQGRVTDIFDRDSDRIRWDTFGAVSDRVGNLYSDLLGIGAKE